MTRCPRVPLVACQKAQPREICTNGASFRVKMCSCSNDVFVELMGEEDAKVPVPYVGNCLFTGSQRRNKSARNGLRIFVGKVPRLTPNTCICGAHFDGGKCQDTFSFPARLVWTKPPKTERLSHVSQAARFLD